MISNILAVLGTDRYYPHAICLDYDPIMLWTYSLSDMMICGSYVVIGSAIAVYRFCRFEFRRRTLWLMASFILLCGFTHLTEAAEIYASIYRLDLLLRVATALLSTATAFQMIRRLRDEVAASRNHG
jgi:hypothetical protein